MQVLLSVKPEYSRRIFSGEKKYEFRKHKPKLMDGIVIVYESSPTRSMVGAFSVKTIYSGTPDEIWKKCEGSSGIEKSSYLDYCSGTKLIHAIEIGDVFSFENPIDPLKTIPDFKPPRSFLYLDSSLVIQILKGQNWGIQNEDLYKRFGSEQEHFG